MYKIKQISRESIDPEYPDKISHRLVSLMRDYSALLPAGCTIYGHSAYRPGSRGQHGKGRALDFHVEGLSLMNTYLLAEKAGFTGIGVYPAEMWLNPGIHGDVRDGRPGRWAFVPEDEKSEKPGPATNSRVSGKMIALDEYFFQRWIFSRRSFHFGKIVNGPMRWDWTEKKIIV